MKLCFLCKALILKEDDTENDGAAHDSCYQSWILNLYKELHSVRVHVAPDIEHQRESMAFVAAAQR